MSHTISGRPGRSRAASAANEARRFRRKLRGALWTRRLFSPLFLVVYLLAWLAFLQLCRVGSLRRTVPVLGGCTLFFLVYLLIFLADLRRYGKRSVHAPLREFRLEGNQVLGKADAAQDFSFAEVRHYRERKGEFLLFLQGHRFIWLCPADTAQEELDFLRLKLKQCGPFARQFWEVPTALLLAVVTALGAAGTVWCATPYNGQLSWVIDDWRSTRKVQLVHNNIYTDGLDGILADIREELELPEKLCLVNSFNLHFRADGTVETLYTFLKGFDADGNFAGSWLIDYDAAKSEDMTIYLDNATTSQDFEEEKDFAPLLEGLRVLPLQETVSAWPDEEIYGILYYGERNWGYDTTGIRYLDADGSVSLPGALTEELAGYSISIFCPENEALMPARYLYRGYL